MPLKEHVERKGTKPRGGAARIEIQRLKDRVKELTEERDYYSHIFNNSNDGIIIHDEQGRIFEINEPYCRRLGYSRAEMLKLTLGELVPAELYQMIPERLTLLRKEGAAIFESQDRRKDGTIMPVEVSATRVRYRGRNMIQSVVRDIHKHKLAEELIKTAQADNARLLEEIQRQSRYISSALAKTLEIITEGVESGWPTPMLRTVLDNQRIRMANISLVQKTLHDVFPTRLIEIEKPVRRLVQFNFIQFRINACRVSTIIDMSGVLMDHRRAVPFCLLVTELLSNSLRHAFPEDIPGEILVRLAQEASGRFTFHFSDSGVGIPKDFWIQKRRSLGMHLIMGLIDQLGGTIKVRRDRGTKFTIRFG